MAMFKEKYLKARELELENQTLKTKNDQLSREFAKTNQQIMDNRAKVFAIKKEIGDDLKKIEINVFIETDEGTVLITGVRTKMGEDVVFFNTGKSKAEAEKLLMLAKMEGK